MQKYAIIWSGERMEKTTCFQNDIKVKDNDLSFLNVGDIIWAKRYTSIEEEKELPKGHKESPFLIIKKKNKKVYGLMSTSNAHHELKWNKLYYPIGNVVYDDYRSSYISCTHVYELNPNQYVKTIGHLNNIDLNNIKKYLYIIKHSDFSSKPDIEDKYLDFAITVGDIISDDSNKYYVYSIDNDYYSVYKLKKRLKKNDLLSIEGTYYSFIYKMEKIKIDKKYKLINTFNSEDIKIITKHILENEKKIKLKEPHKKTLQIGSLFKYKDYLYYIDEENEESYKTYKIEPESQTSKKVGILKIKGGTYKTFFNEVNFQKKYIEENEKEYVVKRNASIEEIEYNSNIKKMSRYERRGELNKIYFEGFLIKNKKDITNFEPMTIVKNKNNKEFYLIIDKKDNIIEVVNINNLGDSFKFELEENNNPFSYYKIISTEEYTHYLEKIRELKEITKKFESIDDEDISTAVKTD